MMYCTNYDCESRAICLTAQNPRTDKRQIAGQGNHAIACPDFVVMVVKKLPAIEKK